MKKIKQIVLLLLVACLVLPLYGCQYMLETNAVEADLENFLNLLEKGDLSKAADLLHPKFSFGINELKEYISGMEEIFDISFTNGVHIDDIYSTRSKVYAGEYDGAYVQLEATIVIDGKKSAMKVTFVNNSVGYGIYEMTIGGCVFGRSISDAKADTAQFFKYVESGNLISASMMMHPSSYKSSLELEKCFSDIEETYGFKFSDGITLGDLEVVESVLYSREYDGGYVQLRGAVTMGSREGELVIEFVTDGVGSGIYEITFYFK